jgi:hypothetical protein
MPSIPLLAAVVFSLTGWCGDLPHDPAWGGVCAARRLDPAALAPVAVQLTRPDPLLPHPNPLVVSLQETEIDEEDNDTLEKPFGLAPSLLDLGRTLVAVPAFGADVARLTAGPVTVPFSLRC